MMFSRRRKPQQDEKSEAPEPRTYLTHEEQLKIRNDRIRAELNVLAGDAVYGRQVHPVQMSEPGEYVVSTVRTGLRELPAERIAFIDSEGTRRSAAIFREENCCRWLTVEDAEVYRRSFWQQDVYDYLVLSAPWVADTRNEAVEVLLLRYGILAPTLITPLAFKNATTNIENAQERWTAVFMESFGAICEGCDACAESPEWYIHRLYEAFEY